MTGGGAVGGAGGGVLGEVGSIARLEGWRALFKGNLASVMRFAPTKGLDFFTFHAYKGLLATRFGVGADEADGRGKVVQRMLAGGLAGVTSTALLFPLDNLTTRLAVSGTAAAGGLTLGTKVGGRPGGVVAALRAVARAEGIGGLYRGLGPAALGIFPEAAITYGCYDLLKEAYVRLAMGHPRGGRGRDADPGVLPSLCCGIVAALAGQAVAFPAEVVSRRMAAGAVAGSFPAATRAIVSEAGLAGLYRGLGAASVRVVPMAFLSFGTYEALRVALDRAVDEALGVGAVGAVGDDERSGAVAEALS